MSEKTRRALFWLAFMAAAWACRAQDTAAGGSDLPPSAAPDGTPAAQPSGPARVFSTLAGELPPIIAAASGPYIVTGDIVVPPGKTVTIGAGTFLLFKNFTGLQVHGTLIAAGQKDAPIAFTSEHDQKHGSLSTQEPAPYDWNGITITENAVGTQFEFCRIGYSLYGINALTEYFTVRNCVFRKNGKADLTIKGTRQEVPGGVPYSYEPLGESPSLSIRQGPSPAKITLRTSSIAVFALGCAMGVWKAVEYGQSSDQLDAVSDVNNVANLHNPAIVEDWQAAKDGRDADLLWMLVGFGAGLVGAAGFTVTFFF